MIKKKILIATGGTGGHIFPAYSLANYLINKDYSVKISSDKRGLKYLKSQKKISYVEIISSPIKRKNIFKFLFSIIINIYSILRSIVFLIFNRPAIILGMGGYSSFPICIAAKILQIKFAIYENNLIIGKANKYLLPFSEKIFVSYKELEGINEKYKKKVFEIGNIIREEILDIKRNEHDQLKFDEIKILVLGGSQAAKIFADELPQIFEKIKKSNRSIKVYQQCQISQNKKLSSFYEEAKIDYKIFNFTDNIIQYYQKTNLVITRSGASVLGELINFKIPFISIPLPTSADNHQYKNALFYMKKGYGYMLQEKDIKTKLFDLINSIFNDKSTIENILSNQRQYSDKNIFTNLDIQIKKIINEKN